MRLPYGISNFEKLVNQGYDYIDKTKYIELLENSNESYIFFLRPRRFGKSLFISMMKYYYDVLCKDKFNSLFGKFYIGKQPTPKANSYHILFFEFSRIDTSSEKTIYRDFSKRIQESTESYLKSYGYNQQCINRILSLDSPNLIMTDFFSMIKNEKIYILIDEYDHFANKILADNPRIFNQIISNTGFVRVFYETIKTATFEGIVDRLFITGITPITLDALTSGFNIGKNLSTRKELNEMMGFTENEVKSLIQNILKNCPLDQDHMFDDIKNWYNGYLFHPQANQRIYNPDMILYFATEFDQQNCQYPMELIDVNVVSDYGRLGQLFNIKNPDANYQVLNELIESGQISANLTPLFNFEKDISQEDFISLLFYMGFISMRAMGFAEIIFAIPNFVIKKLYYNFFLELMKGKQNIDIQTNEIKKAMIMLARDGSIEPILTQVENVLKSFSNRDFIKFDEKYIKAILITLINLSNIYYIKSEPEIEQKYPDILLLARKPFKVNYQYMIELKYIKKSQHHKLEQVKADGLIQLNEYKNMIEIKDLSNLKAYLVIFVADSFQVF